MTTATATTETVQNVDRPRESWVLVSTHPAGSDFSREDMARRGWECFGLVRRENGKKLYTALVTPGPNRRVSVIG